MHIHDFGSSVKTDDPQGLRFKTHIPKNQMNNLFCVSVERIALLLDLKVAQRSRWIVRRVVGADVTGRPHTPKKLSEKEF